MDYTLSTCDMFDLFFEKNENDRLTRKTLVCSSPYKQQISLH